MKRLLLCAMPLMILSGCATSYGSGASPWALTGGYWDQKGPANLYRVGFSGNSFLDVETANRYAIYRSAEVAQREGKMYFVMYRNIDDAILDKRRTRKEPGMVENKPSLSIYIRLLDDAERGSFAVEEVLTKMRNELEESKQQK